MSANFIASTESFGAEREKKYSLAAKKVVRRVKEIVASKGQVLPLKGMLTGQAVAQFFLEEVGFNKYKTKKPIKINDIDIFQLVSEPSANMYLTTKEAEHTTYIVDGYKQRYAVETSETAYIIVNTKEEGILNTTEVVLAVRPKNAPIQSEAYRQVLTAFDINSTQFCIDLENESYIMTRYFEEFMKSGQLKIIDFSTPFHTMVRLVKKVDEIGAYVNLEEELSKTVLFADLNHFESNKFGTKYHNLFTKYKVTLDKYFILTKNRPYVGV